MAVTGHADDEVPSGERPSRSDNGHFVTCCSGPARASAGWFQLLGLVIGVSSVSLGILLATFMGGMCIGSLLLPRVVSAARHPLQIYALLEIGVGISGIVLLYGKPALGGLYAGAAATASPATSCAARSPGSVSCRPQC